MLILNNLSLAGSPENDSGLDSQSSARGSNLEWLNGKRDKLPLCCADPPVLQHDAVDHILFNSFTQIHFHFVQVPKNDTF